VTVRKLQAPPPEPDHPSAVHDIVDALRPLAFPISALRGLDRNPHHGDVEAHMRSLRRFGQRLPLVARRDGKGGIVTAGNHRLEAAKRLGWTEVAVIFVDEDATQAAAFAAADNHLAALGWDDPDLLADLLIEVRQADRQLYDATGYADTDLAQLLGLDGNGNRERVDRRKDQSTEYESQWAIIVNCADEAEQLDLLEKFGAEGLTCRALIS
jgi:ParB-like chromosome segregation protein Spo0J